MDLSPITCDDNNLLARLHEGNTTYLQRFVAAIRSFKSAYLLQVLNLILT